MVGRWGRTGTDAEQRMECRMPGAASIEAEHELVQVVLEVRPAQSMVDAEAPSLGQGRTMCAAIGPTVIALCLISGMSL